MVKIDKTHKQIDLRNIDLKKAKELGIKLGSVSLALFVLSGCGKKTENEQKVDVTPTTTYEEVMEETPVEEVTIEETRTYSIQEHDPSELVGGFSRGVSFQFDDGREVDLAEMTYDDLSHVVECYLVLDDDESNNYDYLNYMTNVQTLKIFDNESTIAMLDNIDGSRLPDGIIIEIIGGDGALFDREKYSFLEDVSDIDTLKLMFSNLDSSFVQSLKQVNNLILYIMRFSNFEYSDMTYLDSLTLNGRTYDVVMYFSTDAINELESNGVNIIADNLQEIKDINGQIDDIVESLNVDENATEQEKLNAVLTYVLTELAYDPEIAGYLARGEEHDSSAFYEEGALDAAMTNETQVCGNYAAITSTLLRRLGVEAYDLSSNEHDSVTHAWNAVKIGDYYFFVDACWLDNDYTPEYFANNDTRIIGNLTWYLVDPTDANEIDPTGMHDLQYIPAGMEIQEIPDEIEEELRYRSVEDISDKEFEVTINGKIVTISAAAFVGVLSALGIGKLVYDKKERERRRRFVNYGNRTIPREEYRRY